MLRGTWLGCIALMVAVMPVHAMEVLKVETGPSTERGIYTMDAHVQLNTRPVALRYVVSRLCDYKDQMENLSYCRVFRAEGVHSWSYALVLLPVISPRDYVVHSQVNHELNMDGTGTYTSCWEAAPGKGPGPRNGVVRVPVNSGCWTFRPTQDGRGTLLHYEVKVAPGGGIPSWAAGHAAAHTLPAYMRLLERLANEADAQGLPPLDPARPWDAATVAALDDPLPPPKPPLPLPPIRSTILSLLR